MLPFPEEEAPTVVQQPAVEAQVTAPNGVVWTRQPGGTSIGPQLLQALAGLRGIYGMCRASGIDGRKADAIKSTVESGRSGRTLGWWVPGDLLVCLVLQTLDLGHRLITNTLLQQLRSRSRSGSTSNPGPGAL